MFIQNFLMGFHRSKRWFWNAVKWPNGALSVNNGLLRSIAVVNTYLMLLDSVDEQRYVIKHPVRVDRNSPISEYLTIPCYVTGPSGWTMVSYNSILDNWISTMIGYLTASCYVAGTSETTATCYKATCCLLWPWPLCHEGHTNGLWFRQVTTWGSRSAYLRSVVIATVPANGYDDMALVA